MQSVQTESGYKLVAERYGLGIVLVNPSDRDWTKHRYVLWFGAYGSTRLMVWANSLEDGLDAAVDWIVDHAPGLLSDDEVEAAYEEALSLGSDEENAQRIATVDKTCAGNASNYLNSWEWGIVCEDPTRAQLEELLKS